MEYLTIRQFAEKIGMSRWNVYKILENQGKDNLRKYPRHKIAFKVIAGLKLIPESEVERFTKGKAKKE